MPNSLLNSFLGVLEAFRIVLTSPSYANMVVVACGWVLTQGSHAVTEALVRTGVAGRRHHEAFHRFFSRGSWDPDRMGLWMFRRLEPFLKDGTLRVVLDDTLAPKKGPHVFGIGNHLDAVRSTKRHKVFSFGHCWVVLAVLVRVPFSERTWALPVLFRLHRNFKECAKAQATYAKKTESAREMLDLFVTWVGKRRVEVAADSAYCCGTVTDGLSASVVLFGAMRPDAVLTSLPTPRVPGTAGRPSLRGAVVPKPKAIADDPEIPWESCTATLYGRSRTVWYKTLCAQWYRACGVGLLRIVIVRTDQGTTPIRVFFCTDAAVPVVLILETYASRWGIEIDHPWCTPCDMTYISDRQPEALSRIVPMQAASFHAECTCGERIRDGINRKVRGTDYTPEVPPPTHRPRRVVRRPRSRSSSAALARITQML